ncbi:ATP-dependent metallopeptidase FtsH/Yme1/Tma family protein [Thermithiobacillus plumbiphilus]|uniref:AAA family ATPase n=1 Tax=Thermithiobacillus plumbiphilus TaxID=1729899 RepID=A0ABU9D7J5_9PROT
MKQHKWTKLLKKHWKVLASAGALGLVLWTAFALGQMSGFKASPERQLAGDMSLTQVHAQIAREAKPGQLFIGEKDTIYQQANGVAWRISDFAEHVNKAELNFYKEKGVQLSGAVSMAVKPGELGRNQVYMKTVTELGGQVLMGLVYGLAAILLILFLRQTLSAGGPFAKRFRQVRRAEDSVTRFADVAGHAGPKLEVGEIVDYLKSPERFQATGAKVPRGILLYGPPGNGKTLLAKAIAGEAEAGFLEQNASSFVQLYVGAGAMAVRDLFREARKQAPCVIFIDEIDAVGGARNGGSGTHDERLQTLNALLAEMDGFGDNAGLVVVAATNQPDQLDEALVRPGRFDRKVFVPLPGRGDRLEILQTYIKRIPKVCVDMDRLAVLSQGFSGAELANWVNEAAIEAARADTNVVTDSHFAKARDRILMGPLNHGQLMTDQDRRTVAYHEAGHAIMRVLVQDGTVEKVSILPRGMAMGVTVMGREEERVFHTRQHLAKELRVLMGGRAAEEIFCDAVSSGASNDMERASRLAQRAICELGFGSFGPYVPKHDSLLLEGEREAAEWVNEAYERAHEQLSRHSEAMHRLAQRLLECDEVDGDEVLALMQESGEDAVEQLAAG